MDISSIKSVSSSTLLWVLLGLAILAAFAVIVINLVKKLSIDPALLQWPEDRAAATTGNATLKIGSVVLIFAAAGNFLMFLIFLSDSSLCSAPSGKCIPWQEFGIASLIGAAAAGLGALAGFIFGIPRTLDAARAAADVNGGAVQRASASLAANTNLERVSDWLTTLLLGATLVQLRDIPTWLKGLANFVKGARGLEVVTPFATLYYFVLGFLGIYLVTRLYLTTALSASLTAPGGPAADPAEVRRWLTTALTGDAKAMRTAIVRYRMIDFGGGDRWDPETNALYARLLAKHRKTAGDATFDRDLIAAAQAVAKDDATRAVLAKELDAALATGDDTLDKELAGALSAPTVPPPDNASDTLANTAPSDLVGLTDVLVKALAGDDAAVAAAVAAYRGSSVPGRDADAALNAAYARLLVRLRNSSGADQVADDAILAAVTTAATDPTVRAGLLGEDGSLDRLLATGDTTLDGTIKNSIQ